MRALTAVLFLAVCAYLGAGLLGGLGSDREICRAELVTLTESTALEGIAVRREQIVSSQAEAELRAEDGKRLPKGGLIAVFENESILSPESALFFRDTDGLEYLSPEMLSELSVEKLRNILSLKSEKSSGAAGRLVLDNVWYFAAFSRSGRLPEEGENCRVLFEGKSQSTDAKVISSDTDEGIILLRINQGDGEFLSLRKASAELVFSEYTGLKLPKSALHLDAEGNFFVYTLTAGLKDTAWVDIIYTGDDFYLAALSSSADALRAGSAVIVSQEEIYEERTSER